MQSLQMATEALTVLPKAQLPTVSGGILRGLQCLRSVRRPREDLFNFLMKINSTWWRRLGLSSDALVKQ